MQQTPIGPMPTDEELMTAIQILARARYHGGKFDILLKGELHLEPATEELGLGAPEELMDCILNVGNGRVVLRKFIEIR